MVLRKDLFWTVLEEIPGLLIGLDYRISLEFQFLTMLDKNLRLSSWTPSNTHNKHLRELLRNALLMLNDLGGDSDEEYHNYLRDFIRRHTAFCTFTLDICLI